MASLIIPQRQQQTISIHSPPRIVYIQISADRAPPGIVKAALHTLRQVTRIQYILCIDLLTFSLIGC